MANKIIIAFAFFCCVQTLQAQEINAKVSVNAQRVATTIDKKIFTTLQTALANFINNRKWTNDAFKPEEKLQLNFVLTIDGGDEPNYYNASLNIQAGRPVFNSSYVSPLINYLEANVKFKYVEYQPVEFNENRVAGSDPQASNLTAIFAYYIYMTLGFDYSSFTSKGGDPYFQKAMNIVNNAPDGKGITGWRPFDGQRNRYWLAENMTNPKYNTLHDAFYIYYRQGLDNFYDNEVDARGQILNALTVLNTFNNENPNTMIIQFLMQGKSQELIKIFKKANSEERMRFMEVIQKLDIANLGKYKEELK